MSETTKAQTILTLANKCAESYDIDTSDAEGAPKEGSITWTVGEAYDAGYRQALEDAAKVAENELAHSKNTMWVVAEIRALGERGL